MNKLLSALLMSLTLVSTSAFSTELVQDIEITKGYTVDDKIDDLDLDHKWAIKGGFELLHIEINKDNWGQFDKFSGTASQLVASLVDKYDTALNGDLEIVAAFHAERNGPVMCVVYDTHSEEEIDLGTQTCQLIFRDILTYEVE